MGTLPWGALGSWEKEDGSPGLLLLPCPSYLAILSLEPWGGRGWPRHFVNSARNGAEGGTCSYQYLRERRVPQVQGELDGPVMTEICTVQNRILKDLKAPFKENITAFRWMWIYSIRNSVPTGSIPHFCQAKHLGNWDKISTLLLSRGCFEEKDLESWAPKE